jgi:hypothetical protein
MAMVVVANVVMQAVFIERGLRRSRLVGSPGPACKLLESWKAKARGSKLAPCHCSSRFVDQPRAGVVMMCGTHMILIRDGVVILLGSDDAGVLEDLRCIVALIPIVAMVIHRITKRTATLWFLFRSGIRVVQ